MIVESRCDKISGTAQVLVTPAPPLTARPDVTRRGLMLDCTHHNTKHCKSNSRSYNSWRGMMQRCLNPNNEDWPNYGGRGITICPEWRTFVGFYRDMGDPPVGFSLDRIDSDQGYFPENCRWASITTQSRNQRRTRRISANGECLPLGEWADKLGADPEVVRMRIDRLGWSAERAVTTPVRPQRPRKP